MRALCEFDLIKKKLFRRSQISVSINACIHRNKSLFATNKSFLFLFCDKINDFPFFALCSNLE